MLGETKRLQGQNAQLIREKQAVDARLAQQQRLLLKQAETAVKNIWSDSRSLPLLRESHTAYDPDRFSWLGTRPGRVRAVRFLDGLLLRAQTEDALVTRQHTLLVQPNRYCQGELAWYKRTVRGEDSQWFGDSREAQHTSLESLSEDPISALSIMQLAGAVSVAAEQGWPHTLTSSQLTIAHVKVSEAITVQV